MGFKILATDASTGARVGELQTPHGKVITPAYMPVGTKGVVKTLSPLQLKQIGVQMILCNTYHLTLVPGEGVISLAGGLHSWMGWQGPILTDSGGYQIFSLARLRRVAEEGVSFQSHIDGKPLLLTPEKVISIQQEIGSDIMMPLDHPAPFPSAKSVARDAMLRTGRWLKRSLQMGDRDHGLLFAIVQGGVYEDLRRDSIEISKEFGPAGFAIGGLSMGESKQIMQEITELCGALLPRDSPRYLMGVGTPSDIVRAVAAGMDIFDCILPTRLGRNGWAFIPGGIIKLKNHAYKTDLRPLEEDCPCYTCRNFTRSYLRHLYVIQDVLALSLISLHNTSYYQRLMQDIRSSILEGRFGEFFKRFKDTHEVV